MVGPAIFCLLRKLDLPQLQMQMYHLHSNDWNSWIGNFPTNLNCKSEIDQFRIEVILYIGN